MLLRNENGITIETYDKEEIKKLSKKGYVSIYEDIKKNAGKKKTRLVKRSTRGTKGKRST
jgi:hypothetical protein